MVNGGDKAFLKKTANIKRSKTKWQI